MQFKCLRAPLFGPGCDVDWGAPFAGVIQVSKDRENENGKQHQISIQKPSHEYAEIGNFAVAQIQVLPPKQEAEQREYRHCIGGVVVIPITQTGPHVGKSHLRIPIRMPFTKAPRQLGYAGEPDKDHDDQQGEQCAFQQRHLPRRSTTSASRLPCAMHSARSASVMGWSSAMPAKWLAP